MGRQQRPCLRIESRGKKRMHTPWLNVWKLSESNVRQEFARVVEESKNKLFETDNVESKQNAMKEVCQKSIWVDKWITEA